VKRKIQKLWKWSGGIMFVVTTLFEIYVIYHFANGLITGDHPDITEYYFFNPMLIILYAIGIRLFYLIFREEDGYRIYYKGDEK
jgi:hypothetical protein